MDFTAMLIDFTATNYKCLKNESTLSLTADNSQSLNGHVHKQGQHNILRGAVIYGSNGGGKTTVIAAMKFFVAFMSNSPSNEANDLLVHPCFAFDPSSEKDPISFKTNFLIGGDRYEYSFSYLPSEVISEELYCWASSANSRKHYLIKRLDKKIQINNIPKKKAILDSLSSLHDNQLILPQIAGQSEKISEVLKFFKNWVFINSGKPSYNFTCDLIYRSAKDFKGMIEHVLKAVDVGIESVSVKKLTVEEVEQSISNIPNLSDQIREDLLKKAKEDPEYTVSFRHKNSEVMIPYKDESGGTQKIFNILGLIIHSMFSGGIMLFDELDHSLHSALTQSLLSMLHESRPADKSQRSFQYICNIHDTTLLAPEILRRDQVWFVDKDDKGETELFSLIEFNDRSPLIQRNYLDGKYGAVPIIKRFTAES